MTDFKYINVMAILVEAEVDAQLEQLAEARRQSLRPVEIITYAMNRLKPLYACSQNGYEHQLREARQQHSAMVTKAVRYAIVAVQRDPLRRFVPMALTASEREPNHSSKGKPGTTGLNAQSYGDLSGELSAEQYQQQYQQQILESLQNLLQKGQVRWQDLPVTVQQALKQASRTGRQTPEPISAEQILQNATESSTTEVRTSEPAPPKQEISWQSYKKRRASRTVTKQWSERWGSQGGAGKVRLQS
jgi:hypothetical protein